MSETGKSTSGGAIQVGRHWIKSWSSTQKTIALSSGEAELLASIKMSTELMGVMSLAEDWGTAYGARVFMSEV